MIVFFLTGQILRPLLLPSWLTMAWQFWRTTRLRDTSWRTSREATTCLFKTRTLHSAQKMCTVWVFDVYALWEFLILRSFNNVSDSLHQTPYRFFKYCLPDLSRNLVFWHTNRMDSLFYIRFVFCLTMFCFHFQKFKLMLLKRDDNSKNILLNYLRKINDHLGERGTRFLTGDTMCCFDCELMPKLQHIRVAGKVYSCFVQPYKEASLKILSAALLWN